MRVLLFTGKGGVGKTTVAAATALHAARCGVKAIVLSTDTAHSLADAFAHPAGHVPVEVEAGLFVQQVDVQARAERSWQAVQEYLVAVLDSLDVDPVAVDELTRLPATEELLALLEVRDHVEQGPWDLVVLDCAPTAETMRLLTVPEVLTRLLHRLLPVERRLLRAMSRRQGALPEPTDQLVRAAERLTTELAAVSRMLAAPDTSVRLVLTPEDVVVAETRRTWTGLALHGHRVDGVVANRLVPDGADPWLAGWARSQRTVLDGVEQAFHPLPLQRAGYAAEEPVGVAALAAVGEQLYGPPGSDAATRLLAPPAVDEAVQVEREGTGYVLAVRVPLAGRDDVQLARQGDDLLVEVAGRRRELPLPSALRRCTVTGARLRDGWLRIGFEPDPALWRPL